jgi:hypothetical protein
MADANFLFLGLPLSAGVTRKGQKDKQDAADANFHSATPFRVQGSKFNVQGVKGVEKG